MHIHIIEEYFHKIIKSYEKIFHMDQKYVNICFKKLDSSGEIKMVYSVYIQQFSLHFFQFFSIIYGFALSVKYSEVTVYIYFKSYVQLFP